MSRKQGSENSRRKRPKGSEKVEYKELAESYSANLDCTGMGTLGRADYSSNIENDGYYDCENCNGHSAYRKCSEKTDKCKHDCCEVCCKYKDDNCDFVCDSHRELLIRIICLLIDKEYGLKAIEQKIKSSQQNDDIKNIKSITRLLEEAIIGLGETALGAVKKAVEAAGTMTDITQGLAQIAAGTAGTAGAVALTSSGLANVASGTAGTAGAAAFTEFGLTNAVAGTAGTAGAVANTVAATTNVVAGTALTASAAANTVAATANVVADTALTASAAASTVAGTANVVAGTAGTAAGVAETGSAVTHIAAGAAGTASGIAETAAGIAGVAAGTAGTAAAIADTAAAEAGIVAGTAAIAGAATDTAAEIAGIVASEAAIAGAATDTAAQVAGIVAGEAAIAGAATDTAAEIAGIVASEAAIAGAATDTAAQAAGIVAGEAAIAAAATNTAAGLTGVAAGIAGTAANIAAVVDSLTAIAATGAAGSVGPTGPTGPAGAIVSAPETALEQTGLEEAALGVATDTVMSEEEESDNMSAGADVPQEVASTTAADMAVDEKGDSIKPESGSEGKPEPSELNYQKLHIDTDEPVVNEISQNRSMPAQNISSGTAITTGPAILDTGANTIQVRVLNNNCTKIDAISVIVYDLADSPKSCFSIQSAAIPANSCNLFIVKSVPAVYEVQIHGVSKNVFANIVSGNGISGLHSPANVYRSSDLVPIDIV